MLVHQLEARSGTMLRPPLAGWCSPALAREQGSAAAALTLLLQQGRDSAASQLTWVLAGEVEGAKLASPALFLQGQFQLSPAPPAFRPANEFPSQLV